MDEAWGWEGLLGNLGCMGTVFLENAGRGELPKLVTYHVLRHEYGVKDLPVVNKEGVADKVGGDCGTPRPCFDRTLNARVVDLINLFEEMLLHERALFK